MTKKTINQLKENFHDLYEKYMEYQKKAHGKEIHPNKITLSNLFLNEAERYIGGKFDATRIFSLDEIEVLNYAHDLLFQLHRGQTNPQKIYENLKKFVNNTKEFYQAVTDMNCGEYYRLLEEDKNINTTRFGATPLIQAVKNHHLTLVLDMVRRGVDVNQPDQSGYTPLYYALENKSVSNEANQALMVQFLLQSGAKSVNLDGQGVDAMSWAIMNNRPKCLMVLLQQRHPIEGDIKNENGQKVSFLNYAIQNSLFNVFQVLVANGADVKRVDETGYSPIVLAEKLKRDIYKEVMIQAQSKKNGLKNASSRPSLYSKIQNKIVDETNGAELSYLQNEPKRINSHVAFGGRNKSVYPINFVHTRND